ncbi:uncharacterized protein LOC143446168 [Clavelina lepadiformis]|uniref:uncharacterized protein LOC143446168 n=1 Tax=Clavelina lepadiformis TaxID=159417 RepID=UPI004042BFCB
MPHFSSVVAIFVAIALTFVFFAKTGHEDINEDHTKDWRMMRNNKLQAVLDGRQIDYRKHNALEKRDLINLIELTGVVSEDELQGVTEVTSGMFEKYFNTAEEADKAIANSNALWLIRICKKQKFSINNNEWKKLRRRVAAVGVYSGQVPVDCDEKQGSYVMLHSRHFSKAKTLSTPANFATAYQWVVENLAAQSTAIYSYSWLNSHWLDKKNDYMVQAVYVSSEKNFVPNILLASLSACFKPKLRIGRMTIQENDDCFQKSLGFVVDTSKPFVLFITGGNKTIFDGAMSFSNLKAKLQTVVQSTAAMSRTDQLSAEKKEAWFFTMVLIFICMIMLLFKLKTSINFNHQSIQYHLQIMAYFLFELFRSELDQRDNNAGNNEANNDIARLLESVLKTRLESQGARIWETGSNDNINALGFDQNQCSICREAFEGNQTLCKLACGHIFHWNWNCILGWLKRFRNDCPLCRKIILNPDDE